ncbi:hypothetical protein B0H13DRAFT_1897151 [Mycena leptocephala]|nr:hypothetical protein B0H13DRAFT_1897151 [Mycena leptocephala]
MPLCNSLGWLLLLSVSLLILQQLQSTIFTPLCALPFLRSWDVCRAVHLNWHWCSATPFLSSSNWCHDIGQTDSTASGVKVGRFIPTAVIGDIHKLLVALDNLTLVAAESSLDGHAHALLRDQVKLVVETGLACKNDAHKYTSELSADLILFIDSSDVTLTVMESPPGWLPRRNQASAKLAFRQTIQTFDHYIHDLVHSGNQTSECMGTLDNHVHAAKHLLDEAKRLTNQQIDHLRGIWSCLGGNRSLLADARARLKVITAARVQTQTIHEMIWDAQAHLKQLQTSCHNSEPARPNHQAINAPQEGGLESETNIGAGPTPCKGTGGRDVTNTSTTTKSVNITMHVTASNLLEVAARARENHATPELQSAAGIKHLLQYWDEEQPLSGCTSRAKENQIKFGR